MFDKCGNIFYFHRYIRIFIFQIEEITDTFCFLVKTLNFKF